MDDKRLTIGVLVTHLTHKNDGAMWQGVVDAARERDANVICFVGSWQQSPYGFEAQANAVYDLVSAERVDGLVIMAGPISQFVQPEEKRAFIERYRPLPIVTLESGVGGTPDIYVDSLHNMRNAVRHLIQVHNYRRIAFIRGPENHQGAEERYRAYVETLAESDIPFDPALVSPPLNWYDGRQGISWLVDQQADFEAVIGANDDLATGAMEELHARGIRVPGEVAVIGYDDAAQSRWLAPPLTTVPIKTYEWGRQALEMVLDLIEGNPVPEQVVIPTELIVRQSCGCMNPTVMAAGEAVDDGSSQPVGQQKLQAALAEGREKVVAEMARLVGDSEEASRWVERVLDGFVTALTAKAQEEASTTFLRMLEEVLYQVTAVDGDVAGWQDALSVMRRHLLSYFSDGVLLRAETLWQQARVLIAETMQQAQARSALEDERQVQVLQELGQALITTFNVGELMDALAEELPLLGVSSAYLSLYEDPQPYTYPQPVPEWSRLVLAYSEKGRVDLGSDGMRFSSRQLVPEELWHDRSYSYVVKPLYFRDHQIGFVLFEAGSREGRIYEALRGNISSALYGDLLLRAREKAERELEQAYARVEQQVRERTAELERAQEESLRLQREVIEAQQRAIQELSTPIIPVLEGVIVMPLIGSIDTLRARDVTRNLLAGIREHDARVVILDITGVPIVDSGVAAYLNKTIQAARLKGARTIVTGISEAVAETIVDLGIDWSGIETLRDLRTGLRVALKE